MSWAERVARHDGAPRGPPGRGRPEAHGRIDVAPLDLAGALDRARRAGHHPERRPPAVIGSGGAIPRAAAVPAVCVPAAPGRRRRRSRGRPVPSPSQSKTLGQALAPTLQARPYLLESLGGADRPARRRRCALSSAGRGRSRPRRRPARAAPPPPRPAATRRRRRRACKSAAPARPAGARPADNPPAGAGRGAGRSISGAGWPALRTGVRARNEARRPGRAPRRSGSTTGGRGSRPPRGRTAGPPRAAGWRRDRRGRRPPAGCRPRGTALPGRSEGGRARARRWGPLRGAGVAQQVRGARRMGPPRQRPCSS